MNFKDLCDTFYMAEADKPELTVADLKASTPLIAGLKAKGASLMPTDVETAAIDLAVETEKIFNPETLIVPKDTPAFKEFCQKELGITIPESSGGGGAEAPAPEPAV